MPGAENRNRLSLATDDATESIDWPGALFLELKVTDPETVDALSSYAEGPARDEFALSALRIGILALGQARGHLDADTIRRESERLLGSLQRELVEHASRVNHSLTGALKEYFDPENGRFEDRVRRLVTKDGELEQVLRRQVGAQDSELCRTLTAHFGQESQLMKLLSPDESRGLLAALRGTLDEQLKAQREHVLGQFSLDNKEGALARLIVELEQNQGKLTVALAEKIDQVVQEFSLDKEDSALSRLVKNVDRAQRTISAEFSLDNDASALSRLKQLLEGARQSIDGHLTLDDENSALARLKRELLSILDTHSEGNKKFQEEVKVTLGQLVARREEAARSTRHGDVFESAVCEFLAHRLQSSGDTLEEVGRQTGMIKHCKVGDGLITLGPECAAAGAKIVVEAKEDASCDLRRAQQEIETARKNRDAQIGLFVFSKKTAPESLTGLNRYGQDVFVVWDAESSISDLWLEAGISLAKALAVRANTQRAAQAADFQALDEAVLEVERQANSLEEITKATETIKNSSEKILDRVRISRKSLAAQVEVLKSRLGDLKDLAV